MGCLTKRSTRYRNSFLIILVLYVLLVVVSIALQN